MNRLEGKVALVTGGSRGIGAAIVKRLADEGADVAFTYAHAADVAEERVAEIELTGQRGVAIAADSADPSALTAAVERTVDTLARIDIVVNNAGTNVLGALEDVTVEAFDQAIAVYARAAFVTSQAAAKHMDDGGRIVSIGTCFVDRLPMAGATLYTMSKSALIGLTKGLAQDLGPRGITVNLINPGPTDTAMNPADGPMADAQRSMIPLGRYGLPDDIAATVAHLASEDGRHITGTSIAVDGGWAI